MKTLKIIALGIFLLTIWATPLLAGQDAELKLWKRSKYLYGPCGHCAYFQSFYFGRDRRDFTEFNSYHLDGYYTAELTGPADTAVTLYGQRNFGEERGYLVIIKEDEKLVQVMDLETYPNEKWTSVPANEVSGAFRIYFKAYPLFARNVASVAWKNNAH
jgi:hypothetical protein